MTPARSAARQGWALAAVLPCVPLSEPLRRADQIAPAIANLHAFARLYGYWTALVAARQPRDTARLVPVAWQHLGVRLDWSQRSSYRSLRLDRSVAVAAACQGFVCASSGGVEDAAEASG